MCNALFKGAKNKNNDYSPYHGYNNIDTLNNGHQAYGWRAK